MYPRLYSKPNSCSPLLFRNSSIVLVRFSFTLTPFSINFLSFLNTLLHTYLANVSTFYLHDVTCPCYVFTYFILCIFHSIQQFHVQWVKLLHDATNILNTGRTFHSHNFNHSGEIPGFYLNFSFIKDLVFGIE